MNKRLGIIQSRGLGDLFIALPIAGYYRDQAYDIHWPIAEEFVPTMQKTAPWIRFHPLRVDHTRYFYDTPKQILEEQGCEDIICLYQALSSMPELTDRPEFQITKFDQIKYSEAGVPFLNKWYLKDYITRSAQDEQSLVRKLNPDPNRPIALLHLEGSDYCAEFYKAYIPREYRIIEVKPGYTPNITDWLTVIERAEIIVCIDSVIANIVDQMLLTENRDCYFIPRSHIQLTPVLGGQWHYLDPGLDTRKRITIFR